MDCLQARVGPHLKGLQHVLVIKPPGLLFADSLFLVLDLDVSDVLLEWKTFVLKQKEDDWSTIITEENLKPDATRKIIDDAFRDGELNTNGTEFDAIMPAMSLFGGGKAAKN